MANEGRNGISENIVVLSASITFTRNNSAIDVTYIIRSFVAFEIFLQFLFRISIAKVSQQNDNPTHHNISNYLQLISKDHQTLREKHKVFWESDKKTTVVIS